MKTGNFDSICEAIQKLMVTDEYIRALPFEDRLKFLKYKEILENMSVPVIVFSVKHQSGEQLEQLSGIAAILKYPIVLNNDNFDDDDIPFDE